MLTVETSRTEMSPSSLCNTVWQPAVACWCQFLNVQHPTIARGIRQCYRSWQGLVCACARVSFCHANFLKYATMCDTLHYWVCCLFQQHASTSLFTCVRSLTILCCRCFFLSLMNSLCCLETKLTAAYSSRAANTNRRHTAIQMSMAFT